MPRDTPLRRLIESYREEEIAGQAPRVAPGDRPGAAAGRLEAATDVEFIPYGVTETRPQGAGEIVGTLGPVEAEYAALRKGAGLLDCPHRGTLSVGGSDRADFLNRMLTADLRDLKEGVVKPSFWLNRQGRIEADLLLIAAGGQLLLDLDLDQAEPTATSLGEFLFTEEVEIRDLSADYHRLALHGPAALPALSAAAGSETHLENGAAVEVSVGPSPVVVARCDQVGETGLHLVVRRDQVEAVWRALIATDQPVGGGRRRIRPVGWYAYNTARIEAGTPLFHVDFGPGNLPHETGVLSSRVSFTKGCFPGQEIVARMENLGRPKQRLVGLRLVCDALPGAGSPIFEKTEAGPGDQVGVVTSSTLSPLLGAAPIALGMVRSAHARDRQLVLVNAEGEEAEAVIGPLSFLASRSDVP